MATSSAGGNRCPIFAGSPHEAPPSILTVSFASDPSASLGVQLANHDNGLTNEMFIPGYASVGGMLDSPPGGGAMGGANEGTTAAAAAATTTTTTLARRCGVRVGDVIVAVNWTGYRRFPPDFDDDALVGVTEGLDLIDLADSGEEEGGGEEDKKEEEDGGGGGGGGGQTTEEECPKSLEMEQNERDARRKRDDAKSRVITSARPGESYGKLLQRIRDAKSAMDPRDPLVLSLERYTWDSRVHSWSRFLSARGGNVPAAMTLIQSHERWRSEFFPIDLTEPGLQGLLRGRAVSVIDHLAASADGGSGGGAGEEDAKAPVVYIDFAKLQRMGAESDSISADVVKAFVVYTETLLSKAPDPRRPKTSQFVDLSGVSIKNGLQPGVLRKLYATFEPNYPETLERMVLYPVPRLMVRAVNAMLSFVNEHTREKFVITDDLDLVCRELGWDAVEVGGCEGGVNGYMKKHLRHGSSFVFD